MKVNDNIMQLALELAASDANEGVCLHCGEPQDCVEPDAERYKCESCNKPTVYGGMQIIMLFA